MILFKGTLEMLEMHIMQRKRIHLKFGEDAHPTRKEVAGFLMVYHCLISGTPLDELVGHCSFQVSLGNLFFWGCVCELAKQVKLYMQRKMSND